MLGVGALPLGPTMGPPWPGQPQTGKKRELLLRLYEFLMAPMTNDHKLHV